MKRHRDNDFAYSSFISMQKTVFAKTAEWYYIKGEQQRQSQVVISKNKLIIDKPLKVS